MPEIKITIGGRDYAVARREGEEHFLRSAAQMLDTEAQVLKGQIGRMPESRVLLMAGLMLADKTAGLEDQLRQAQERLATQESQMAALRSLPHSAPTRVEVPIIPPGLTDRLAELATQAEAMAAKAESRFKH